MAKSSNNLYLRGSHLVSGTPKVGTIAQIRKAIESTGVGYTKFTGRRQRAASKASGIDKTRERNHGVWTN